MCQLDWLLNLVVGLSCHIKNTLLNFQEINTELVKLLTLNQTSTRAAATEYDCEMGDHSFLGWPHESSYRAYQPYNALAR